MNIGLKYVLAGSARLTLPVIFVLSVAMPTIPDDVVGRHTALRLQEFCDHKTITGRVTVIPQ